MLKRAERYRILRFYRILSIVGLLPIEFDLANWTLTGSSKRKRWICFLFLGVLVFHTLYKNGSLASAYNFDPTVQVHQLVIHAVYAMGSIMNTFFYFMVYISDSALFTAYASMTLRGSVGGLLEEEKELQKYWKRRICKYSKQDWIAVSLQYMVIMVIPLTIIAFVYDPSMKLLLYAAFPIYLQHWTAFGLALFEETRFKLVDKGAQRVINKR